MKKIFINFARRTTIIIISLLLTSTILVFSAMLWPTNSPTGETVGGKFVTYFNNIRGDCGPNELVYGFNDDFSKKCKSLCIISETSLVGTCITQ
ncbi:MAG: hypothetical protein PHI37_02350 [Candidatus Gracilibacteria bacterium]|nr:hypothetical protein [Candidatus Gracilibacteria bacterium]